MYKILVEFEDLLKKLQRDYPELNFRVGKKFMYRPPRTVYYEKAGIGHGELVNKKNMGAVDGAGVLAEAEQNCDMLQLLHEVGHGLLHHETYKTDVERVKIERAAWDKAAELCEKYGVRYDEDFVEAELDTYRDWLHQKTKCPECGTVRYQDEKGVYHCPFCEEFIKNRLV